MPTPTKNYSGVRRFSSALGGTNFSLRGAEQPNRQATPHQTKNTPTQPSPHQPTNHQPPTHPLSIILTLLTTLTLPTLAQTPDLKHLSPLIHQTGTTSTLSFHGKRLTDPQEIIYHTPGITTAGPAKIEKEKISYPIKIAPDAPLGLTPVRLRCNGGITYQRTLWLTPFPITWEKDDNNQSPDKAQPITQNITVAGTVKTEQVDHYKIPLKKGQQLSIEAVAMRLGHTLFDPQLSILNPDKTTLVSSDDTALTKQDPYLTITAKQDGDHYILIRESSYQGNNSSHYALNIGNFPRPAAIYPPAAKIGTPTEFTFINTNGTTTKQTITPKEDKVFAKITNHKSRIPKKGEAAHTKSQISNQSPTGIPIRSNNIPTQNEIEPNNGSKETQPAIPVPAAFNGIIQKNGDIDWFKFHAKKGQNLRISAYARRLGSPLDARLILRDPKGKYISYSDDNANHPDSQIDFKPTETGDYIISIRDHLAQGSPTSTYRIEITEKSPSIAATLERSDRNDSQKRKILNIPQGNRLCYKLNIARSSTQSPVTLTASSLPQGVTLKKITTPKSATNLPLFLEAAPNAPLTGGLYPITINTTEGNLTTNIKDKVEHVAVNNVGIFTEFTDDRLAIAVIDKAPFTLTLATPPVAAVKNGTISLNITANRDKGFDKDINLYIPWLPPGITAPGSVKIKKGETKATYPLTIKGDAPTATWQLCVNATAYPKQGPILLSSNLTTLKIQDPYLTAKMELAATTQGTPTSIPIKIEHTTPFEGNATLTLHGLPDGFTAKPVTINKSTKQTQVPIELTKDARTGNHSNLFLHIEIPKNNHTIPHNTAQGGSLRVNAPPKNKPKTTTKKPKSQTPKKPLSRLEQLRQQNK